MSGCMGDRQRNDPSWDTAGGANGPALEFFPRRDVVLLLGVFHLAGCAGGASPDDIPALPLRRAETRFWSDTAPNHVR
jgi:hypothetical protein